MNPHIVQRILQAPLSGSDVTGSGSGTFAQAKESDSAGTTTREAASRLASAATEMGDRTKTEARRVASDAKDTTADRIGGYSSAMHSTAQSMEREDPNIAWVTHQVADRIQGVADYLRNRELSEVRRDAENFARRHPVAFFGGLFLTGLVVGNLLKAKPEQSRTGQGNRMPMDAGDEPLAAVESAAL